MASPVSLQAAVKTPSVPVSGRARRQASAAGVHAPGAARDRPAATGPALAQLVRLQGLADASTQVGQLGDLQDLAAQDAVQRKVFTAGSKNPGSVTAPSAAKAVALRSQQARFRAGGKNHLPLVAAPHGGYKLGSNQFVGGSVFNNAPMADGTFLPRSGGQTYTEWDVRPYEGGGRGTERVVVSSDGRYYYTNDHYKNFSEFKP